MNIEVVAASIADRPVLRQMMELYLYDFSRFADTDLNEHGYFDYINVERGLSVYR